MNYSYTQSLILLHLRIKNSTWQHINDRTSTQPVLFMPIKTSHSSCLTKSMIIMESFFVTTVVSYFFSGKKKKIGSTKISWHWALD